MASQGELETMKDIIEVALQVHQNFCTLILKKNRIISINLASVCIRNHIFPLVTSNVKSGILNLKFFLWNDPHTSSIGRRYTTPPPT